MSLGHKTSARGSRYRRRRVVLLDRGDPLG